MVITSVQNETIKKLRKDRAEKVLIFWDNPKVVEDSFLGNCTYEYAVVNESSANKFEDLIDKLLKTVQKEVLFVSQNVFDSLAETKNSQGILVALKYSKKTLEPPGKNYLVLDGVQDPGNVGTLLRSALGAGFEDIYLLSCASLANDKVVRSAMGLLKVNAMECSREEFIKFFHEHKKKFPTLYACDLNGENLYQKAVEEPCGIVIGNEGNGISTQIRALCNWSVTIPMQGGLESLNAAVSGAIMMFHITNQKK